MISDPAGRLLRRAYDGNGNVVQEARETGAATHYTAVKTYDGLNRQLLLTESVQSALGGKYVLVLPYNVDLTVRPRGCASRAAEGMRSLVIRVSLLRVLCAEPGAI